MSNGTKPTTVAESTPYAWPCAPLKANELALILIDMRTPHAATATKHTMCNPSEG